MGKTPSDPDASLPALHVGHDQTQRRLPGKSRPHPRGDRRILHHARHPARFVEPLGFDTKTVALDANAPGSGQPLDQLTPESGPVPILARNYGTKTHTRRGGRFRLDKFAQVQPARSTFQRGIPQPFAANRERQPEGILVPFRFG